MVISAGRSPSRTFFTVRGSMHLQDIIRIIEDRSKICILEGFREESDQLYPQIRVVMDSTNATIRFQGRGEREHSAEISFHLWAQFDDLVRKVIEIVHQLL